MFRKNNDQEQEKLFSPLPSGSGKTFIAAHAIKEVEVSALFITPRGFVESAFQFFNDFLSVDVVRLDPDVRESPPVAVSSIENAQDALPSIGPKFGLVVVNECHKGPCLNARKQVVEAF